MSVTDHGCCVEWTRTREPIDAAALKIDQVKRDLLDEAADACRLGQPQLP
ncbi:MAG: hypothetical protein M3O70_18180 [Actinomycetota bacterium]|nr:hypothetical protein [Actinomycetota bacterium]